MHKTVTKSQAFLYENELHISGISTKHPAREHIQALLEAHGLELAEYEPFGPEDESFGGLALGLVQAD